MAQDGGQLLERPIMGLEDLGFGSAHCWGLYNKAPINTLDTEGQWSFLIDKHIYVPGRCPDSMEALCLGTHLDLTQYVSPFGCIRFVSFIINL